MPKPDPYLTAVAEMAHLLWCRRVLEKGWTPGAEFDEGAQVHDALVTYKRLGPVDQRAICAAIDSEDLVERLSTCIRLPRGGAREFGASELRVGLRVSSTPEMDRLGNVESWEEDPDWPGCVNMIRVRWDSGETTEHAASECGLWRLDEGENTEARSIRPG